MSDKQFEINERLPVPAPVLSDDFIEIDYERQDSVSVTFTGKGIGVLRDQILRKPEMLHINVPMPDQEQTYPYSRSLELTENNVRFSGDRYSSLSAISFNPPAITVTIDHRTTRYLPVRINAAGSVPERYLWPVLSNTIVQVTGARSVVNQLDSCYTGQVGSGGERIETVIEKPDGINNINPSSVIAGLIYPVPVIELMQ
ncbi:MAG: hypothetical protein KAW14_10880 [Candidatus Aegiribacteria sp.]|nr:hypothetical protein [Candidatus Aegiribacteria sp.]